MTNEAGGRAARRVTSADVAREAGVSRATVSYVLNNTPHQSIPDETRRRVREAATRLHYTPSAAARTLSRGHSDVVLYLLPETLPLYTQFGVLLEQLSSSLARAGLTLVAHPWSRDQRPTNQVWKALAPVAVLAQHLEPDEIKAMHEAGVRVARTATEPDEFHRWSYAVQDEICDRQVEALAAASHERLGYAIPDDERVHDEVERRHGGVRRACAARGLPEPVALVVGGSPGTAAKTVTAWRSAKVTGICAFDDVSALAVLAGLRHRGLSAPADLAVVGVYDSPVAKLADPPLTTVAIDAKAMADYAAKVLLRRIEGKTQPRRTGPAVTRLVARDSV